MKRLKQGRSRAYAPSISYEFKNVIVKETIELVDTVKRNTKSIVSQNSKSNSLNESITNVNTVVNSNNIDNSSVTEFNSDNQINNLNNSSINNVVDTTSINSSSVNSSPVENILSNQLEKGMLNEQSFSNSSVLTDKTVELANKTVELAKTAADNLSSSLAENFVNTLIDITNNNLHSLSTGLTIVSR